MPEVASFTYFCWRTVLEEECWTQAAQPITLLWFDVRQCQDQYKVSYVGSVLYSEGLVSKITAENPKNCKVFTFLVSSIAHLNLPIFSQKTIQQALDNEKNKITK